MYNYIWARKGHLVNGYWHAPVPAKQVNAFIKCSQQPNIAEVYSVLCAGNKTKIYIKFKCT